MSNQTTQKLYRDVDSIMYRFDFEKVAKVMKFLDWKWAGSPDYPTRNELKRTAALVLDICVENFIKDNFPRVGGLCSTGGLTATITVFGDVPELSLAFSIEEKSSYSFE